MMISSPNTNQHPRRMSCGNGIRWRVASVKLRFRVECEDSAVEPEVHLDAVQFMAARIRFAFTQLDEVDVPAMFARRGVVMQNVPRFLRGAFQQVRQ